MPSPSTRKYQQPRREVDLYNFGKIRYTPGARSVSGSFEMTGFPVRSSGASTHAEECQKRGR